MTKSKYLPSVGGNSESSGKHSEKKRLVLKEALKQVPNPPDIPADLYRATAEVLGFLEEVAVSLESEDK